MDPEHVLQLTLIAIQVAAAVYMAWHYHRGCPGNGIAGEHDAWIEQLETLVEQLMARQDKLSRLRDSITRERVLVEKRLRNVQALQQQDNGVGSDDERWLLEFAGDREAEAEA